MTEQRQSIAKLPGSRRNQAGGNRPHWFISRTGRAPQDHPGIGQDAKASVSPDPRRSDGAGGVRAAADAADQFARLPKAATPAGPDGISRNHQIYRRRTALYFA